jgi:branched-chain amino acid aminotransferase
MSTTQSIAVRRAEALKSRPSEDSLGFGRHFTDHMFRMDYVPGQGWHDARVEPYAPLAVDPAAAVFHYGQAVFEGLKVFRGGDGVVRAFRVDDHCRRFAASASAVCIPPADPAAVREGIAAVVREDRDWVPAAPGTSLYVRPAIVATEGFLGVRPASEYACFVILTPVGGYFAAGVAPVRIWVEEHRVRAAPGGLGAAKTGANYAASLAAATEARERGYAQVLWLDACERRWLEEVGTMNLFVRIGDEVVTPPLDGTLLAGITRDSVLALLRDWGVPVSERRLSTDELREAHRRGELREAFGTGTAAVISPVGAFGFADGELEVGGGGMGELSQRLYEAITGIQFGNVPDRFGWMTPIA